jgi:YebC/PmpR family DNA-binding regulatory protein
MAGHSHWANIKNKKAAIDAKRGKVFSKFAKHIMIAARNGGGNPAENLKLRYAIERARAESMPKDSIERAIKKGTGELEGGELAEMTYEGIGPGGMSLILEIVTDNRHRTSGEIRNLIEKRGGSLGKAGSVTWKFSRVGILELARSAFAEDELFEAATEAGADDFSAQEECYRITTSPDALESVREAIQKLHDRKVPKAPKAWGAEDDTQPLFSRHEVLWQPQNPLPLEGEKGRAALQLLNLLEDHDDVQNVYSDADFPEELLKDQD